MVANTGRYGPHTAEIECIIARVKTLTIDEIEQLGLEWSNVFSVETDAELAERNETRSEMFRARKTIECRDAWCVVYPALQSAFKQSLGIDPEHAVGFVASWNAIRDAASATITQDLLSTERYRYLVSPWEFVVGPITDVTVSTTVTPSNEIRLSF